MTDHTVAAAGDRALLRAVGPGPAELTGAGVAAAAVAEVVAGDPRDADRPGAVGVARARLPAALFLDTVQCRATARARKEKRVVSVVPDSSRSGNSALTVVAELRFQTITWGTTALGQCTIKTSTVVCSWRVK